MSRPEGAALCNTCASAEHEDTIVTRGVTVLSCEECGTLTRERTIGVSHSPPPLAPRMAGLALSTPQMAALAGAASGAAIVACGILLLFLCLGSGL